MNKNILIILTSFFAIHISVAQDLERKGFAAFNIGGSLPTGSFASSNFSDDESGYATSGLVIDFALGYKINRKFGLTALYRSLVNGYKNIAYADDLANYFKSGSPSRNPRVFVESEMYSLGGLLAGIYGSAPIQNKIDCQPYFLVGLSAATLPYMTTETYESGTKLTTFIRERAGAIAFSYMLGARANMSLSNQVSLLLNLDFFSAKASWESVQEIGIGHTSNTVEYFKYDYYQKFKTLNISAGLGFKF